VRADRLVSLVLLLHARGRMTAADIAAQLSVSVRTVYRDMAALSAAGVPVYAESGPHGGCQLMAGYQFPLRGLRPEEAETLLILGVPDVLNDLGVLGTRRDQAAGGIPETRLAPAGRAGSAALVHLDMPGWFRMQEPAPQLQVLAAALRQRRRVELRYRREGAASASVRTVTPLGLVNKAGIWYLVAMRHGPQPVVYRAGRITSASITAQPGLRPATFDLGDFWRQWSEEFASSRPQLAVTMLASPLAVRILPEVFGDSVRAAIDLGGVPGEDGWRELTLTFEHELAAAHRLAGFGAEIEVISPAAVRDRLVETARLILRRYVAMSG
jgi:predicted DNA-binding transcriptional regulator YafY